MIEARGLSKRYGDKLAVDDLSFMVRPGRVAAGKRGNKRQAGVRPRSPRCAGSTLTRLCAAITR